MTVNIIMKKSNKIIPGFLPTPPKSVADGKITDLSSKTVPELLELRDRQLKLLNNRSFISKLEDKGAKIQTFYNKVAAVLKENQDKELACSLFSTLKLSHVDKEAVLDVEWKGKVGSNKDSCLDSDDDSEPEDVMHILSLSTATEKIVKVLQPEKPIISVDDIIEIGDLPHIKYLVDKTEVSPKAKETGQFKPFRTTKSDVHNPEKEILRKKHKHWEVTAATPPPIIHGPAKLLSLDESMNLQKQYNIHLKEVEAQHAAEKLMAKSGIKMLLLPSDTSKFGTYRQVDSEDSDESDVEGSDKEIHDEEPERGGVVFTVMK